MVSLDTWDTELLTSRELSQPNYGLSEMVIVTIFCHRQHPTYFLDIFRTKMMTSYTVKKSQDI